MNRLGEIRKRLHAWLLQRGFVHTSKSSIWIQDQGFYFIVAELQPLSGYGFFLSMGVKFLWTEFYGISYDYSVGDIRIYGQNPPHPTGAIFYDSPSFEDEVSFMLCNAGSHISEYQKLRRKEVLLDKLSTRSDFVAVANPNFRKRDQSLGIVKILSGDAVEGKELLKNDAAYTAVSAHLLEYCDNETMFVKCLCKIVNECRAAMSSVLKLKLDVISEVFE